MFSKLNANSFIYNQSFYWAEFEDILSKVILCYQLLVSDNVTIVNDENKIRDLLLIKYLKNNTIRNSMGLNKYLFDREVPEDETIGRTDIKIQTLNSFTDTSAYYILECKRIDDINQSGLTGLNAKYILNGIYRFTSNLYSSHYKVNGMIGFVVKKLNIVDNIGHINTLLKSFSEITTIDPISNYPIGEFQSSYLSKHTSNGSTILIYHLMLDFSDTLLD